MQSTTQSKAPTNKKSKKKKIPCSFEPKTSTYIKRPKHKKPVIDTQHAKEPVATANILESLDTSNLLEEVANQPLTAAIEKADENVVEEKMYNDVGITFIAATTFDQVMEEAKSDLEFIPNDEIMSISKDDDE
nr:hypothetical protein [Tanacetum cinerariifolium]